MRIAEGLNADRRRFNVRALELAQILHDWDPIGVYEGDVQNSSPDEYDDLVMPILTALQAGSSTDSLAEQLRDVLSTDYGLDAVGDIEKFADQVVSWWISAQGS